MTWGSIPHNSTWDPLGSSCGPNHKRTNFNRKGLSLAEVNYKAIRRDTMRLRGVGFRGFLDPNRYVE